MDETQPERPRFEIFRGAEAPTLAEAGCMAMEGAPANMFEVMARDASMAESGGEYVDVPYRRPGMSLTRLWFKSGYPLPLHTHDCDCLYYVLAGSIELGDRTLVAGDGFFVGSEVPYGYSAGPQGAEVLEFRTTESFNIRIKDKPVASWERTAESMRAAQPRWADEEPPVRRMPEKA
ncbi:hypothetical protein B2G71_07540 [Novosphingobium sp. PC22D]|uniref:cupin domain-containing protein n=1 Tax=Novosphingobium sp. PC22D TaxID=1962403 RepID=UPI000BF0F1F6|nr:hypothetical protein [Novosphingobium sp. PC22D]PEQ13281.1 hypothetical protein B2G71_07540 [Novosphingobium sp. PC22D]